MPGPEGPQSCVPGPGGPQSRVPGPRGPQSCVSGLGHLVSTQCPSRLAHSLAGRLPQEVLAGRRWPLEPVIAACDTAAHRAPAWPRKAPETSRASGSCVSGRSSARSLVESPRRVQGGVSVTQRPPDARCPGGHRGRGAARTGRWREREGDLLPAPAPQAVPLLRGWEAR